MRNIQSRRRCDQFAGIFSLDRRVNREEIDEPGDEKDEEGVEGKTAAFCLVAPRRTEAVENFGGFLEQGLHEGQWHQKIFAIIPFSRFSARWWGLIVYVFPLFNIFKIAGFKLSKEFFCCFFILSKWYNKFSFRAP